MNTTGENSCRSSCWWGAALSLTVALILERFCWGFTVDDAWIISRVAAHGLKTGVFSFNLESPATDAVTPLGFAQLVAALGALGQRTAPLELWGIARAVGLLSFLGSMALVGYFWGADGRRALARGTILSLLALPTAAWAGAGLSTALVGFFMTVGGLLIDRDRTRSGAGVLGLAVTLRPELIPFSAGWLLLRGQSTPSSNSHRWGPWVIFAALALLPFLLRFLVFGGFLPLAKIAKAAEPMTALHYVAVTAIWSGVGWLLLVRNGAFQRQTGTGILWLIHLAALFFAGGDWMPALRLTAPLCPLLIYAVAHGLAPTRRFWIALIPALFFPVALLWTQGSDFRAVAMRRLALIEAGRKELQQARVVAATDVGWVGLSTEARIVDLAGVTDPRIAALPGGHTSKAIAPGMFSDRDVDTWVIRALDRSYRVGQPLQLVVPAYWVDARLLQRVEDLGFIGVATIPLEGTPGQYVIAKRAELALH